MDSSGGKVTGDDIEAINDERKHLEGLLKDRINFHLIFAAVFMAGLSKMDDLTIRRWALTIIAIISFVILVAVVRTFLLVNEALKEIRDHRVPQAPYARYYHTLEKRFPFNANTTMALVPLILSLAFGVAAVRSWRGSPDLSGSLPVAPIYQIEDHSDRSIANSPDSASGAEQKPCKFPKQGARKNTPRCPTNGPPAQR